MGAGDHDTSGLGHAQKQKGSGLLRPLPFEDSDELTV